MTQEPELIEGVIGKITKRKSDGAAIGMLLKGREGYLDYSNHRKTPWDDHKEGDFVKLQVVNDKYIEKIKVTAQAEAAAPSTNGHRSQSPDDFKSLHRLEALKQAASDEAEGGTIPALAAVLARADAYARFIEGDFDEPQRYTEDLVDPGWE